VRLIFDRAICMDLPPKKMKVHPHTSLYYLATTVQYWLLQCSACSKAVLVNCFLPNVSWHELDSPHGLLIFLCSLY